MFNIDKYLKKISKNLYTEEENKNKIIEIVKNITGINLELSDIEIKNYNIFIKTNHIGKSQLFLNKKALLEEIKYSIDKNIKEIKWS